MTPPLSPASSPWRPLVERVRERVGDQREDGNVVGSINWLRAQMAARGANPNVVRNIIYRDKGTVVDKRALYDILRDLCRDRDLEPVRDPELEIALAPGVAVDHAALDLVRREARDAFRGFVTGVSAGGCPSLLITGRPGSGKTLLTDVVHEVLAVDAGDDRPVLRVEFSGADLATSLTQLGAALGAPGDAIDRRLLALDPGDAYAVQADVQAAIARELVEAVPASGVVLLAHVSQSQAIDDTVGSVPLRLNTPDVPRVRAADWLWLSLLEPIARRAGVACLVSMVDVPARAMQRLGPFEGAVRLSPPSLREARRFVSAHRPEWSDDERDALIERAGRSYEDIRTLILLETVRDAREAHPAPEGAAGPHASAPSPGAPEVVAQDDVHDVDGLTAPSIERLARAVVVASDARLRDFLAAVAVLSTPERPEIDGAMLDHLRGSNAPHSRTEASFLDPLGPQNGVPRYRCFSRQLARALRDRLRTDAPARYRALHARAADFLHEAATRDPAGDEATAWLEHALEAEAWGAMVDRLSTRAVPHAWLHRAWGAASTRLARSAEASPVLDAFAMALVRHHRYTGTAHVRDAADALAHLDASDRPLVRTWSAVQRAAIDADAGDPVRARARIDACDTGPGPSAVDVGTRATRPADTALDRLGAEASAEACAVRAEAALATGRPAQAMRHLRRARRALGTPDEGAPDGLAPGARRPEPGASEGVSPLVARIELLAAEAELRTEHDAGRLDALAERLATIADPGAPRSGSSAALRSAFEARRGRLAAAQAELDRALDAAEAADAPPLRRSRLHLLRSDIARRRGDLATAETDLRLARRAVADAATHRPDATPSQPSIPPELAARIALQHGHHRLAAGDVDGAIQALAEGAEPRRAGDGAPPGDPTDLATAEAAVALAEAYAARALGAAGAFGVGVDAAPDAEPDQDRAHAAGLLADARALLEDLAEPDDADARDARFAALLASVRLEAPGPAEDHLRSAAALATLPAQRAVLDANTAAHLLRTGDAETATLRIEAAEEQVAAHELDAPGLHLRLAVLRVEAALRRGERARAVDALVRIVRAPAPELWIDGVLRLAARRARTLGHDDLGDDLASALGLDPSAAVDARVRPPDRLVAIRRAGQARRRSRSGADAA